MRTYAEAMAAARPGRPFSNGTEGYAWMEGQVDIFAVFADQISEQATREAVSV